MKSFRNFVVETVALYSDYLFHVTDKSSTDNIRNNGLQASTPEHGPAGVYFWLDYDSALMYANNDSAKVIVVVPKNKVKTKIIYEGAAYTTKDVSPSAIETILFYDEWSKGCPTKYTPKQMNDTTKTAQYKAVMRNIHNPEKVYRYAHEVLKARFPQGEDALLKSARWACEYAMNIIKGRWPEAENTIAQDSPAAYRYATDVIKGRWPEGEDAIALTPRYAYWYASYKLHDRFPKGEPGIMKSEYCIPYVHEVIKGRWPEAENGIIQSRPSVACEYAIAIKQRFPEGEKKILTNPSAAAEYAVKVIKGRWPEAEKIIKKDATAASYYKRYAHADFITK